MNYIINKSNYINISLPNCTPKMANFINFVTFFPYSKKRKSILWNIDLNS